MKRQARGDQSYYEKLQSPRWQRKRLTVFKDRQWECEFCGDTEKQLHVHHNFYISGKEPWQYSHRQLTVLCVDCHKTATENLRELREALSLLDPSHLPLVIGFINAHIADDGETIPCRSVEEAMGIAARYYVKSAQVDEVVNKIDRKTSRVNQLDCFPDIFVKRF